MAVPLQIINDSVADYSIDVLKGFGRFYRRVGNGMNVVGHNYVSVDGEAARLSGFVKSVAGNRFDCLSAKDL